jgi:iron complex outermembrane receptor protein
MRKTFPSKRKAITLGVILAGLAAPVVAQDGEIEEVVVTGSFIRGSALDAPSPVQVVDRASIEAQGAAIIWDVIKNLEVNSGSFTNSGSGERAQTEGTAQVNLRNLGENSTLTLINGKRMAPAAATTSTGGEFVNINNIPLVMTDRVEILTDGGSALYGADAVAGVVNIIMRTDFEGLELYGDIQNVDSAGSAFDETLSAIWGWASDDGDTHFVVSGERFERDKVAASSANFIDEFTQFNAGVQNIGSSVASPAFGANPNPAYFRGDIVADNLANGGNSSPVWSDPLCTTTQGATGIPYFVGNSRELRGERGGNCNEDVERFNYLARETERSSFAMAFDHTFSEAAEFYSFANYSENKVRLEGGGLNNTGGSASTRGPTIFFAQPGAYTRNPAYGGNAIGQTMELGFFAPNIGLTRPTNADIPNAPVDIANGGINIATISNPRDGIPRTGQRDNSTETNATLVQAGLRGDFNFQDRAWNYDVSVSWSATSNEQTTTAHNRRNTELAANGLGGAKCVPNGVADFDYAGQPGPFGGAVPQAWDYYGAYNQTFFPGYVLTTRESTSLALTSTNQGQGDCQFYNPFLTALTNPDVANDPALVDWMTEDILRADKRNKLMVFDALVGGELFDMAGGPAAIALGLQYRERNTKSRASGLNDRSSKDNILGYDANGVPNLYHNVENNYECAACAFTFDNTRDTSAVFVEMSLPFLENVETQIAIRYEDYGGNIGSEVSPKFAMSWRPMETLLLRGSFSQSFRAPNIDIIETGLESNSLIFKDPISNQQVRAGLIPPTAENGETEFTYTLGGPAPNVGNEYADTFNAGFLWTPEGRLEGLSVGADFWRFEVSDRVLPQPGISAVQPEIDLFNAVVGDPNNYILNDSISSDSPVLDVACDPNALETQFGRDSGERLNCVVNPQLYEVGGGQGIGISRSARSENASLITLTLAAINAGEIEADGVDMKLGYNWDNDWGRFRASIDYTHVNQYKLIGVPGLELGLQDTGKDDAAGTTGNGLHVRSLPDNKGNITLNWQRDRHGMTLTNRHIGSYQDLAYDAVFETGNDLVRSLASSKIDSYDTWDIQYRYAHDWGNASLGTTNFTVGVLDMFDEEVPHRETTAGSLRYDATVFDPRGRRLYARALWSF